LRSRATKAARCRFIVVCPSAASTNIFAKDFNIVSLGRIQAAIDAGKLDAKKTVDVAALAEAGVIRRVKDGVRCSPTAT
jgi:large subunit ribosomal protein L15